MTEPTSNKRRHITLPKTSTAHDYTVHAPNGISKAALPDINREQQYKYLFSRLHTIRAEADWQSQLQTQAALTSGNGIQVEFVGRTDVPLAFESLSVEKGRDPAKYIELLSIRKEGEVTSANVFIPEGKIAHFEKYLEDYVARKKNKVGKAADHRSLIDTLSDVRLASLLSLWTDPTDMLPVVETEPFWWEVWLPIKGNRQAVLDDFRRLATLSMCAPSKQIVKFPERTVTWMYGSQEMFSAGAMLFNCIAELKRAKDTSVFFTTMDRGEQRLWAQDMLLNIEVPDSDEDVPYVCLLDTGVNRGHPLLAPILDEGDMHTIDQNWGTDDRANHGTGMAGLAAFGDLFDALASSQPLVLKHRLESVKLTPGPGGNPGDDKKHAYLFSEAVARPEIFHSKRRRVFSSAITSTHYRDFGRPSSWSAMVDRLAVDADVIDPVPRLFVLSAGNINDTEHWRVYPDGQTLNQIHDPGQAWNALTVGAFTEKMSLTYKNFRPIAASGGISPFSSTSSQWDSEWPLKPDVVFEGGNAATDGIIADCFAELELLTTANNPLRHLYWTTNATSAASAQCAKMAAELMVLYPEYRPETIRALITHSARWTPEMLKMYPAKTQSGYVSLIRHCGWGVPDAERARWSVSNSLTLVEESSLKPYRKSEGVIKTNSMNLHALPWPKDELLALQNTPVEMRVTLSYFIEPNPSARGQKSRFNYPSHRLRFVMKRPLERYEDFITRVNAASEEEGDRYAGKDNNWDLGPYQRHRGSLHQDIWRGTAAELANCGYLAVYPGQGWWRSRQALKRFDSIAEYSLIISIHTTATGVDLLTPIETLVEALIESPVTLISP